jgi:alpha-L-fucosidase
MRLQLGIMVAVLELVAGGVMIAQPSGPALGEPARRQWFNDSKFGIFIHWGPYSVIGRHEWARHRYQIPQQEYDTYARAFNPSRYNADEWVRLFEQAGAKYVVITTKHHDGFAIYRSKVSDYDMEITPYAGDPLKMLAEAAKKRRLRLGFYHSIMDWHHPDYSPKRAWEPNPQTGDMSKYLGYMKLQLRELLTQYGDVAVMWFDGEWEHPQPGALQEEEIAKFIHDLQPNTLINDRLWNRRPGNPANYGTPEQFVPARGIRGPKGEPVMWESCVTINEESWGYNQYETVFKTPRDLIRMLIEVVSKGGNLLLNVGPKPDGTIQEEFVVRLKAIGEWMKGNSEAIYGTTASPFDRLPFFGRVTTKGNTLYLHVFEWPKNGKLELPGLKNRVVSAEVLTTKAKVAVAREGSKVMLTLPGTAPDPVASVVKVTLDGAPDPEPFYLEPDAEGALTANAGTCEIETRFEQRAKKENLLGHVFLTKWTRNDDIPAWRIRVEKAGRYEVRVSQGAARPQAGVLYTVELRGPTVAMVKSTVRDTANENVFKEFEIGDVVLEPGEYTLRVRPEQPNGTATMQLEHVKLRYLGE